MPEPTLADLLAGILDLAEPGRAPHPARACGALCSPTCTADSDHPRPGRGIGDTRDRRPAGVPRPR